jgi:hypothetical protein
MLFGAEVWAQLTVLPLFGLVLPCRCNLMEQPRDGGGPAPSAANAKQEPPVRRVSSAPPRTPPAKMITLPEEVVVKAIGVGQPAFLSCWARAQRTDPVLISTKVHLHLEIDADGKVASVRSDSDSPKLASCLAVVARQLPFPAPGKPAVVDMPLIFR